MIISFSGDKIDPGNSGSEWFHDFTIDLVSTFPINIYKHICTIRYTNSYNDEMGYESIFHSIHGISKEPKVFASS